MLRNRPGFLLSTAGGQMLGSELCCDTREDEMPFLKQDIGCDLGSMQDLYVIIKEADKIITF